MITSVTVSGSVKYGSQFTVEATGQNLDGVQLQYGLCPIADGSPATEYIDWQTSSVFNDNFQLNAGFEFYAAARVEGDDSTIKLSDATYIVQQAGGIN